MILSILTHTPSHSYVHLTLPPHSHLSRTHPHTSLTPLTHTHNTHTRIHNAHNTQHNPTHTHTHTHTHTLALSLSLSIFRIHFSLFSSLSQIHSIISVVTSGQHLVSQKLIFYCSLLPSLNIWTVRDNV